MQYSPKLKKAAEEIKTVLKKYDIGGAVALHTPEFGEFILDLSPSYSCAKLNHDNIHFKAKKEDYNDELKRQEDIRDTAGMLRILVDLMGNNTLMMIEVSEEFDKLSGAKHSGSDFTSHTSQNN